jgi:dienelactone hydrolase
MRANLPGRFIVFACLLTFFTLQACSSATPIVEIRDVTSVVKETFIVEVTRVMEVTREVEVPVIITATPFPATPTPSPSPTSTRTPRPLVDFSTETVSFTTKDGYELFGTLFQSEGDIAVVLAHMAGDNDQQNWVPFAKQLAPRGYTALTFDFRCFAQSECGGNESGDILLSYDLSAAMDFLREQGFEQIVCMGASMGGRGCVSVAFDQELAGLVILSGTAASNQDRQNLDDFVTLGMPKLFVVTENDSTAGRTQAMIDLYESAPKPKVLKIYPGKAHGTDIFNSSSGQALRELIIDFLEGIRASFH